MTIFGQKGSNNREKPLDFRASAGEHIQARDLSPPPPPQETIRLYETTPIPRGHLHRTVTGTCRWVGGENPDPVSNRSAHKRYSLSQYTLLKTFICIPCERERVLRSSVDSRFVGTGKDGLSILLCIIIHS